MLDGLLRHGTEMTVEKNYVDSHGQSTVAFAFCHLLNFQLLPRLKGIHRQKLSRPTTGQPNAYPHLQAILTRPIRWERIHHQYDTMMQYATALRLGTADAQTILKRFTWSNYQHPTYRAIVELGEGRENHLSLSLPARRSSSSRNPRRTTGDRKLEQRQRIHLLRTRRGHGP